MRGDPFDSPMSRAGRIELATELANRGLLTGASLSVVGLADEDEDD